LAWDRAATSFGRSPNTLAADPLKTEDRSAAEEATIALAFSAPSSGQRNRLYQIGFGMAGLGMH
jgi:hypothetical protein